MAVDVTLVSLSLNLNIFPGGIYLFKVNNGNTRTVCKICSKLTIKAAEQGQSMLFCLYCEL